MIPLAENPTVRVYIDDLSGDAIAFSNNVHPTCKVEIVRVPPGRSVEDIDKTLDTELPYKGVL